jgi:GNAT superfamily N-acetyltransferase
MSHDTPQSGLPQAGSSWTGSSQTSPRGGAERKPANEAERPNITVRRLSPTDSISEITRLLHRAYAKQVAMGLAPLAGRQTDAQTEQRLFSGEAWVAIEHVPVPDPEDPRGVLPIAQQKIVGIILYHEIEEAEGPAWFHRPDVAWFSQFAVDPTYQGCGIGQMLLETVQRRAREDGARELGLSMAEPDTDLMNFYMRRGYRFVEHWQWPYTNYRSVILSKPLAGAGGR